MKVEMIRNSFAGGKFLEQGEIAEVSDKDGKALIESHKAKVADKGASVGKPKKKEG